MSQGDIRKRLKKTLSVTLDYVNNLGWTAMIEVVVPGDSGENHVKSLKHLLDAGANRA